MGEIGISFRCTLCKSWLSAPCQILNAYISLWEPDPVLATDNHSVHDVGTELIQASCGAAKARKL